MGKNLTASIYCSIDKIEAIGKVMIYMGPGEWPDTWDRKDLYQNFGTTIEHEAERIKRLLSDVEKMEYQKNGGKLKSVS